MAVRCLSFLSLWLWGSWSLGMPCFEASHPVCYWLFRSFSKLFVVCIVGEIVPFLILLTGQVALRPRGGVRLCTGPQGGGKPCVCGMGELCVCLRPGPIFGKCHIWASWKQAAKLGRGAGSCTVLSSVVLSSPLMELAPGMGLWRCSHEECAPASGAVSQQLLLVCFLQVNAAFQIFFSLFTVWFLCNSDFLLITASVCLLFPCAYLGQKERALRWRNTFLSQAIHKFFLFFYISLPLCMCMLKFPFPVYKCLAAEVTGVFHSITFARLRT